jgi:hypothetical protein
MPLNDTAEIALAEAKTLMNAARVEPGMLPTASASC